MKTLYILRHAKSSWDDFNVSDHDRKLLPVGKKRTKKIAGWLKKQNVLPDRIISSTAVRAFETARIMARVIGFPVEKIEKDRAIYSADTEDIFEILYALPDTVQKVMIVGHNPDFTDLVNLFLGRNKYIDNLPTSGVAAIRFETDIWQKIDLAKYHVEFVMTPKMVKQTE